MNDAHDEIVLTVEKQEDGYLAFSKSENIREIGDDLKELEENVAEAIRMQFGEAVPFSFQIVESGKICSMCGAIKYRKYEDRYECIGCGRVVSEI